MRIALGTLVIVCVLLSCIVAFFPAAEAVNPTTTLSLDQSSATVQVAPGQTGIVTVTGTVTCDNTPGGPVQKVLVTLAAEAGGWNCSVTPSTMAFSTSVTEQTFAVSVEVPEGTDASMSRTLSVSGIASPTPGVMTYTVGPAVAMINIKQYYKFDVNCSTPSLECKKGDTVTFHFKVFNQGNGDDTVRATLKEGWKAAEDRGFRTDFNSTDLRIARGSEASFDFTVVAPDKASDVAVNEIFTFVLEFESLEARKDSLSSYSSYPVHLRFKDMGASLLSDIGHSLLFYVLPLVIIATVIGSGVFLFIFIRRRRKRGRLKA